MSDPLVSTEWLSDHLNVTQVVDASWFMPGDARTGALSYADGHIPGAVFFDIDAVSDTASPLPHMLPDAKSFAATVGAMGLRRDADVVVYDAQGIFSAPRVWWALRTMGFPRVFVLDGGLKKWRAEGRQVTQDVAFVREGQLDPMFRPENVRSFDEVRAIVDNGGAQLIDARAAGRFRGEVPEPRAGLRSGHMPGAHNVPWNAMVNEDGTLKGAHELREAFEGAGVDLAAPIVTTCGSGVSAAVLALGLMRLGREDVAIYDGSWTEWGGREDAPVVTGA